MDTPARFVTSIHLDQGTVPEPRQYPFDLPAVKALSDLVLHPAVTFFVGENGTGKSTLLEAIAVGLGMNAEGGSSNFNFGTRSSHSPLHEHLRIRRTTSNPTTRWFLRAESFYNVASNIEELGPPIINSYGGRSLHEQSHGESFFALFKNRFGAKGLYLLDEPEAALSPSRQLAFLALLHDYDLEGSQLIIATHSPIIMAYPNAWTYVFDKRGITRTSYDQTEHFKLTREFLNNPTRMLPILFGQDSARED
ncbi:MAG: AAA family ATPase [Hyphomonadaceae bacterium]